MNPMQAASSKVESAACVFLVGPLPPPRNGMAIVNGYAKKALEDAGALALAHNTAADPDARGVAKHFGKFNKTVAAIGALYTGRKTPNAAMLHPCDAKIGQWYSLALIAAARALGYRIFLHHHTFYYINRHAPLIQLMVRIMGNKGWNLLLCECMEEAFRDRYQIPMQTVVAHNSIWYPPGLPDRAPPTDTITIGHFGNLTWDKGSGTFLDLLDDLRRRGVDAHALLMGSATDPKLNAKIDDAKARHGDRLQLLDSTDMAARAKFYASIDFFVMPTQYKVEAQPLVLIEARERGIPVISTDLGCISDDHGHAPNLVVSSEADFANVVGTWLAERKFEQADAPPPPVVRAINTPEEFAAMFYDGKGL
jgi:glycosyltransferase involved in cell wall biosynthesis